MMASLQGRIGEDPSGISVWSEIAQGFWLTPTTKTPETLCTEEIPFISHQGSVQLGYVDTFPVDGIVLLQYKFPHAQPSSLSGCASGAATMRHTASCRFLSDPAYIESDPS